MQSLQVKKDMNIPQKLAVMNELKTALLQQCLPDSEIVVKAFQRNPWFHPTFTVFAIESICSQLLEPNSLEKYATEQFHEKLILPKRIAFIPAGNVPLAGFRDLLDLYLSDHTILFKASSKDLVLMEWVYTLLLKLDATTSSRIEWCEHVRNADSIIASGSNNTYRYLEYYFRNKPSVIRKNRVSLAILHGNETSDELKKLADDVFLYFGLGCRNISHLYVPESYDFSSLIHAFEKYNWFFRESKYMNNYDYNRTLLLMNGYDHLASDWFVLKEDNQWISPLAQIHYTKYGNLEHVLQEISDRKDGYQCVVSTQPIQGLETVLPGMAQKP